MSRNVKSPKNYMQKCINKTASTFSFVNIILWQSYFFKFIIFYKSNKVMLIKPRWKLWLRKWTTKWTRTYKIYIIYIYLYIYIMLKEVYITQMCCHPPFPFRVCYILLFSFHCRTINPDFFYYLFKVHLTAASK